MASDVVEVLVFIASPSDLPEERKALRDLESTLSATFKPIGVGIRVTGWEEVPPDYGRAQEQINPAVVECDIFVGMLRRKWGTETGEHSSGFLEEFTVASKRREADGKAPVIALYFASVPQHEIDDAGPDLLRVMAFQKRIIDEKVALYSVFDGPSDLAAQVTSMITKHLVSKYASKRNVAAPTGAGGTEGTKQPSPEVQAEELAQDTASDEAEQSQILKVLSTLQALIRGETPDEVLDKDRLELLGVALGNDGEPLGTHLVNRLYRRREELDLIVGEHAGWMRTLFDDIGTSTVAGSRVVPGWALMDLDNLAFKRQHFRAALNRDGAVGRGAVKELMRLRRRPIELWPEALGADTLPPPNEDDEILPDEARPVGDLARADGWCVILNRHPGRSVAVDYLLQDIDSTDASVTEALSSLLEAILSLEAVNESSRRILEAAAKALTGDIEDLADALGYSADDTAPWRLVLANLDKLSDKLINQFARQTTNRDVKVAAAYAGISRDTLTQATLAHLVTLKDDEELTTALTDSAVGDTPRATKLLKLLTDNTKKTVTPPETLGRLMALTGGTQVLRQSHDSEFSTLTWAALTYAEPERMLEPSREALRNGGKEARESLADSSGADEDLLEFVAARQMRAAASLLSRQQSIPDSDVDLIFDNIERMVTHKYVSDDLWLILRRIASPRVHTQLVAFFTAHQDGTLGKYALDNLNDAALAPAFAEVHLDHETDSVRAEAQRWFLQQPERTNEDLYYGLYDQNSDVRMTAAAVVAERLDREELIGLHLSYPDVDVAYWYNVIAYFDEFLYAPTPVVS